MHASFLVGEIADRFLGAELYTVTFCCWQRTAEVYFFCLLLKETWISFNHNIVWQLLHRRPPLCLNISTPLTFCAFSKLTPKIKPLRKLYPPSDSPPPLPRRNNRWVPWTYFIHTLQGAKKVNFTACPSDKVQLTSTSPKVTFTSPKKFFASRMKKY